VPDVGNSQDNVTRVEPFACAPMTAVTALVRQSWTSSPRTFTIRTDRRDPLSGTRFKIVADTTLPMLYVDFYQSDGSVLHLVRPALGALSNPHSASVIAPAPGSGLLVAIGSAKPLDAAARQETASAADYLAVLRPLLDSSTMPLAADIAVLTVRPPEPEVPKVQRIDPVIGRPKQVDSATAKIPLSHTPALHSSRCSNIVSRVQLGETLSDAELTALRTECRS
jgi:hypothetical protein